MPSPASCAGEGRVRVPSRRVLFTNIRDALPILALAPLWQMDTRAAQCIWICLPRAALLRGGTLTVAENSEPRAPQRSALNDGPSPTPSPAHDAREGSEKTRRIRRCADPHYS